MFKFSFNNLEEDSERGDDTLIKSELEWIHAEHFLVSKDHLELLPILKDSLLVFHCGNLNIKHVPVSTVLRILEKRADQNSSLSLAEKLHSDLVPAKYEGGLKVWECTTDLLHWLLSDKSNVNFKGKRVLDLGCGAGILGIAALNYGAFVSFQDYNREVLDTSTILNILLNTPEDQHDKIVRNDETSPCKLYSGDWSSFSNLITENAAEEDLFDYILTSETIYNPSNHEKLCGTLQTCLKKNGTIFLAAKTYYFGVGGGLRQFESVVQRDGRLKSEVCWKCPDGLQREILRIEFK